jgi:hypothetical protein
MRIRAKLPHGGSLLHGFLTLMPAQDHSTSPTVSDLFTLLWSTLADIVGTAATATLLRRAARRASSDMPELEGLVISRDGLEYRYAVPDTWQRTADRQNVGALRALIRELGPLLVDLTGPLVVRRLGQLEPLQAQGVLSMEEVAAWLTTKRPSND